MQSGSITVSGIFRAKGNEAPMVYIANADYCASGHEMIRLRNILFTAITRSRGLGPRLRDQSRDDGSSEGNRPGRQERLQTQISNSDTIRVGKDATHQPRPYCSREGGRFAKRREVWKRSSNLFDRESFRRTLCRSFENCSLP